MKQALSLIAVLLVLAACSLALTPAAPSDQIASQSGDCLTSNAYIPYASPTPRPLVPDEPQIPLPTAAPIPGTNVTPTLFPTPVPTPTVTNAPETLPMASTGQSLDGSFTLLGEWTSQYPGGFHDMATGQIDGKDYAFVRVGDDYQLFDLRPNELFTQTGVSFESPPGSNNELFWSGDHLAVSVQTGIENVTYFYDLAGVSEPCLVSVHKNIGRVVATGGGYAFTETEDARHFIVDLDRPENVRDIDISDPEHDDHLWAATIQDGLMYAVSWDSFPTPRFMTTRFVILDVSEPDNPVRVGSVEGMTGDKTVVAGDYAYLMSYGLSIHVIDVSDPVQPVQVGQLPPDPKEASSSAGIIEPAEMIVDGTHLYALSYGGDWGVYSWRLLSVDISDLANPKEIGRFEGRSLVSGMWLQGDQISVVDPFGITVIDASDVANMRQIDRIPSPYGAKAVHLQESGAALFFGSGIFSLDIAAPASPQLLDFRYDGPIQVFASTANPDTIVDDDSPEPQERLRFRITGVRDGYELDASELPDLKVSELDETVLPNNPRHGSYVYSALCGALRVTDESDGQGQNAEREYLRLADSNCSDEWDVALRGDFAYVTGNGSLYIVSISEPGTPTLLSRKPFTAALEDENQSIIRIEDDLAYVLHGGLWVLDLSSPESPKEIAYYSTDAYVLDVDSDRVGLLSSDGTFQLLSLDR